LHWLEKTTQAEAYAAKKQNASMMLALRGGTQDYLRNTACEGPLFVKVKRETS
jgi:hypothetical protein